MKRISQTWRQQQAEAGRTRNRNTLPIPNNVDCAKHETNDIRYPKHEVVKVAIAGPTKDTSAHGITNESEMAASERRSRALELIMGKKQQHNQIQNQKEEYSTPPSKRKLQHISDRTAQNTPPQFDPKIETGHLSHTKTKFLGEDLDISKSISSPLSVSTPTETLPVKRVSDKARSMPSRYPLINGVRPAVRKDGDEQSAATKSGTLSSDGQATAKTPGAKHGTSNAKNNVVADSNPSGGPAHLQLASWGLPPEVTSCYHAMGITSMFEWQAQCLCIPGVLDGKNLVYSAPTSAGKTLVAELLVLKRVTETRRKAILILPFVSVAREKMLNLQNLFQNAGIRVDGFIGSTNPAGGFSSVDVAVCTIEKANSLINRLLDDGRIHTIGTVVVDELHMVGDPHRGYLLELLLTKIRFMASRAAAKGSDGSEGGVQVVGMSATLPNLGLLGQWLDAAVYQTDFRPVPLTESIKVGTTLYDTTMKKTRDLVPYRGPIKGDDDHVVSLCLETTAGGHSVLIFCPTKNWCEKLALNIANNFFHINRLCQGETFPVMLDRPSLQDVIEQLRRTPVGLDSMLAQLVPHGVAFHHAGLTFDERDIIEGAFRQGGLRVLVATSTLSSGVNLPARRVLIRTPNFHGKTIDTLTYKQMVGRAGRKGVDTLGESVLLCKESERAQGRRLMATNLPPVRSCLMKHGEQLSSSMKRAILEVVVSGVASTPADVETYASCTMLAVSDQEAEAASSKNVISACIAFLLESEFVILKKEKGPDGTQTERYQASQLGRAVLSSALSPDEGLIVFAELQRARRNFVLENELHILYQVTPIYQVWTNIDWYHYMCTWETLPPDMRRVAECVGVSESVLARAVQGRLASSTAAQQRSLAIHRRFYTALVLQDLIQEMPLPHVADKYRCTRGVLQSLQQSAATFAGMVTAFCSQLGWTNLELLLAQFQSRLTFGVQRELVDLVRLSLLNGHRARVMFNAGFQTVSALANASATEIEKLLRKAVPFQSLKRGEDESAWEAAERRKVRCIWVTGQKGLSEHEAAVSIITEARQLVEQDLGMTGIKWKPCDKENKESEIEDTNPVAPPQLSPGKTSPVKDESQRPVLKIPKDEKHDCEPLRPQEKRTFAKPQEMLTPKLSESAVTNDNKENSLPIVTKSEQLSNVPNETKQMHGPNEINSVKNLIITKDESRTNKDTIQNAVTPRRTTQGAIQNVLTGNEAQRKWNFNPTVNDINVSVSKIQQENDTVEQGQNGKVETPFESYVVKDDKGGPPPTLNLSAELDDFNDSFFLDTQLVNLMTETATACKPKEKTPTRSEGKTETPNNKTVSKAKSPTLGSSPNLKPFSESTKQASVSTEPNGALTNQIIIPVPQHQTAKVDSGMGVPIKGNKTSADLTLQLDLSNDDDLENFMDQYCTQMDLGPASPVAQVGAPSNPPLPPRLTPGKQPVVSAGQSSKVDSRNTDGSNTRVDIIDTSGQDDLWSDTDGLEEQVLGSSFTESPHHLVNTGSYTGAQNRVPSSNLAILPPQDPDPFTPPSHRQRPKPRPPVASTSRDVSHTEELAYMSLHSDSSALLELEDVAVPDEAAEKEKAHMDLSQYFEENFGSYGAALNDSWSFSLHKSNLDLAHIQEAQPSKDSDQKQKEKGKEVHNPLGVKDVSHKGNNTKAKHNVGLPTGTEKSNQTLKRNTQKRKTEENTPECTPSKVRKTSEIENESDKNESNTSDCVPPTPPELKAATTPKTQVRKTGKKAKKPAKTSQRKSQRLQESTCAAQLNYNQTEKRATRASQRVAQAKPNDSGSDKRGLSALLPNDSPERPDPTLPREESRPHPASPGPVSQSIPLTNERFTIIDVTSNKMLFDHFIMEWRTRRRYALCIACEKLDSQPAPTSTIGANFMNKRAVATPDPPAAHGLPVAEVGLQVVGVAVSWDNRDAYYISLSSRTETADLDDSLAPPPLDPALSVAVRLTTVRSLLGASSVPATGSAATKVMFDAREQYKIFTLGCEGNITGSYQDPKIANWMLDPGAKEQSLHRMVHNRLPLEAFLLEGLGGGVGLGSLGLSPANPGSGRLRACVEAVLVNSLMTNLLEELTTLQMATAFLQVEMPVQIILACMELNGFGFSEEECSRQRAVLEGKLTILENQAYALAGHSFSLSSPEDIAHVLFMELKLPPSGDPANPTAGCSKTLGPARGRGGRRRVPFSTSKDILEKLKPLHPLPALLLEWRRLTAALTKVICPLVKEKVYCPRLAMHRIHSLCQTHTATGRVSMAEPNLQNIPKDFDIDVSDMGISTFSVSMRHAFVPFEGGIMVAADYSQLELRMIAHLSGDQRLINILNEGRDVFKLIAAQWRSVEVENVTAQQRQQAKQVCYGMLYGIGPRALGEQLGVSEEDAGVFTQTFKAKYTGMRSFLRDCVNSCREKGYVETIIGRRRYLPSIKDNNPHARAHAERQAVNTTVQGSAADLVKKAMVLIEDRLNTHFGTSALSHRHPQPRAGAAPHRPYLLLQLHDELLYEVPVTGLRAAADVIREGMEQAMPMSVRMPVKVQAGASWGTLKELTL